MAVRAGGHRADFPEPLATAYPDGGDDCQAAIFDEDADLARLVFRYDGVADKFVHQVDEGLAVLEILCSATPKTTLDSPEFVDITRLSEITEKATNNDDVALDVLELSDDDDDDVVFVTEYKEPEGKVQQQQKDGPVVIVDSGDDSKGSDERIRRNPVRTARSRAKGKAKDVLFEEDFAFLDSSEDELEKKENKPPAARPSTSTSLPKEWPINVHERPDYNPVTKKLEFEHTMGKNALKKIKLDVTPARRKTVRAVAKRKRKTVPVERVPIEELKPLVNSTTDMLKGYFVNSRKHKDITDCQSEICTFENKLEVLKNQALLFSIVNDLDENEVMEKFKLLNVESDAKDAT